MTPSIKHCIIWGLVSVLLVSGIPTKERRGHMPRMQQHLERVHGFVIGKESDHLHKIDNENGTITLELGNGVLDELEEEKLEVFKKLTAGYINKEISGYEYSEFLTELHAILALYFPRWKGDGKLNDRY